MQALKLKIPPVGVFLIVGLAMWGVTRLLPAATVACPGKPYVVLILLVAGAVAGLGGILAFSQHETTVDPTRPHKASALVVANVYRHTRNPMYLGLALVLAAWAAYLSNLAALPGIPVFVAYITQFQIRPEEQALLDRFGAEYALYMSRVRRWL
jgi:protein-S-isoprenylcysteine O-methyltransferase Ste14